jgi:hypothetical protein
MASVTIATAMMAWGCGYSLAGRGSFLPNYIKTVAIPQLENRSNFFQVEQVLTDKIRTEFIGRGKYAVVSDRGAADAVLTGEITALSVSPSGFTEQQLASRYLFTLQMKVQFSDSRTNDVLWSNDALIFRGEYELTSGGATAIEGASFLDQERSSFDRISNDVARTVVTAILEAF